MTVKIDFHQHICPTAACQPVHKFEDQLEGLITERLLYLQESPLDGAVILDHDCCKSGPFAVELASRLNITKLIIPAVEFSTRYMTKFHIILLPCFRGVDLPKPYRADPQEVFRAAWLQGLLVFIAHPHDLNLYQGFISFADGYEEYNGRRGGWTWARGAWPFPFRGSDAHSTNELRVMIERGDKIYTEMQVEGRVSVANVVQTIRRWNEEWQKVGI